MTITGSSARRIEAQGLVEQRMGGERPGLRREQRVAVGLGGGDIGGAERAAGAGSVLDDHRLAPALLQLVGDDARREIGPAARRRRDDDAHRVVRVAGGRVLGLRVRRRSREHRGERGADQPPHDAAPAFAAASCSAASAASAALTFATAGRAPIRAT